MTHQPGLKRCFCDMCKGRRTWAAIVLLLAGAGAAIGLVAWACLS